MKTKLLCSLILLFTCITNAQASLTGLPVTVENYITGSLDLLDSNGTPTGPVPINFYSAYGDFDYSYLGNLAVGYNSTIYTAPGTYSFNSTPDPIFPSVPLSMTVGENQIGMRTYIDWNLNTYDILTVWDVSKSGNEITLTATDMDGDGIRGFDLVSGPFAGFNVTIDATIVTPIPATFVLFGSGLIGLAGFLRRRS